MYEVNIADSARKHYIKDNLSDADVLHAYEHAFTHWTEDEERKRDVKTASEPIWIENRGEMVDVNAPGVACQIRDDIWEDIANGKGNPTIIDPDGLEDLKRALKDPKQAWRFASEDESEHVHE